MTKEVELIYMTVDEDKDEDGNRIYMFAGINDGKHFIMDQEKMYDGDQFDHAVTEGVKQFPLYTREALEKKEMIKKDKYIKDGIVLKEDIYKYIESDIDGNLVIFSVPFEKPMNE
jgi:hypothetical protein